MPQDQPHLFKSAMPLAIALAASFVLASCVDAGDDVALRDRRSVELNLGDARFRLWLACSVAQRRLGLKPVDSGHWHSDAGGTRPGMVFVYPGERIAVFSMKDVPFDLDLALADADGRLLYMTTMKSGGESEYGWHEPVRYAVETVAGAMGGADLDIGDRMLDAETIRTLQQTCGFSS